MPCRSAPLACSSLVPYIEPEVSTTKWTDSLAPLVALPKTGGSSVAAGARSACSSAVAPSLDGAAGTTASVGDTASGSGASQVAMDPSVGWVKVARI